jgi:hypothetical protein
MCRAELAPLDVSTGDAFVGIANVSAVIVMLADHFLSPQT